MEQERMGSAHGGGTAGTGQPEATPDGAKRAGEGQGDDLANRLGGGERSGAGLAAGAGSGSLDAGDSTPAGPDPGAGSDDANPAGPDPGNMGLGSPSAGDVGGMGGAGAPRATGRPPGGVSPIQDSGGEREAEAHPS